MLFYFPTWSLKLLVPQILKIYRLQPLIYLMCMRPGDWEFQWFKMWYVKKFLLISVLNIQSLFNLGSSGLSGMGKHPHTLPSLSDTSECNAHLWSSARQFWAILLNFFSSHRFLILGINLTSLCWVEDSDKINEIVHSISSSPSTIAKLLSLCSLNICDENQQVVCLHIELLNLHSTYCSVLFNTINISLITNTE